MGIFWLESAGISKLLDPLKDFQLAGAKMSRCQVGLSASMGTSPTADLQFWVNQVFLVFFRLVPELKVHQLPIRWRSAAASTPPIFFRKQTHALYNQEFQKQEP